MSNLQFPICSIIISLIITIIFFSKERISNIETKIFKQNLIIQLIESIVETLIYFLAYVHYNVYLTVILNNIVCMCYIAWIYNLFRYIFLVVNVDESNFKDIERKSKKVNFIMVILIVIVNFLPVNLVNENNVMYSYGLKVNFTYTICAILVLLSIFVTILNLKRINHKKNAPLYFLLLFAIIVLIIRIYDPSLLVISLSISLINLIMYFTIENPDVKMLQEITLAKNELEKANQVKTDFIASMSHEIRTPLNAVVGFSELIKNSDTLEEAKENSQEIINSSYILLDMVNKIFDVFQLEKEENEVKYEIYNPSEELNKIINLYEDKIKNKGIDFIKNIDNIPNLIGDPDILKKIVLNVLDNAYKFTAKGSITLNTEYVNKKLLITIEDTGMGIKKEELKTIFKPFSKSSDTKNTAFLGMGLGLSITKILLEKINGKMKIESTYQKGTKVILKINQKEVKLNENISG